jgi:aryl-alcohol dehydrogenase-like predicted oxidoreductase
LVRLCDTLGTPRPIVAQPLYNIVNRIPENDLLPACEYYGIGVVPYSPLARGVLSGKYAANKAAPKNSRAGRGDPSILNRDMKKESLQVVSKIDKHLKKRNFPISDFAVQWILNNNIITSVIGGPRTLAQWNSYVGAIKRAFTAEDEVFVDSLVAPGRQATHGYTWPRYPVRGRRAING